VKPVTFLGDLLDAVRAFPDGARREVARDSETGPQPRGRAVQTIDADCPKMKQQRFGSVWDALESQPSEAANMKARSDVMIALHDTINKWKVTQAVAAKRLGITQPRLNDLVRGRINKFSLDALMNLAGQAGLTVRVKVIRRAA
jgi:predicted XRE-type DNA-binding protein